MTLSVTLPPQMEEMVRTKISSGHFSSVSEVIGEALRLMEERDRREAKRADLRRDIQDGLESGPVTPWDPAEAKSEGRRRRSARISQPL